MSGDKILFVDTNIIVGYLNNDKSREVDPHTLVHIIVDDGFPGAVTGELCPYSGVYTTRAGLERILRDFEKPRN